MKTTTVWDCVCFHYGVKEWETHIELSLTEKCILAGWTSSWERLLLSRPSEQVTPHPLKWRWKQVHFHECFFPYLLTPWSRVLLEKLTGLQTVKKFYRIWMFITGVTSASHLSLSWVTSIQSIRPHPTSWWSILILTSRMFPTYCHF